MRSASVMANSGPTTGGSTTRVACSAGPIVDANFWQRVEANQEEFLAGDTMVLRVRIRRYLDDRGEHVQHTITEVMDHKHQTKQGRLDDGESRT